MNTQFKTGSRRQDVSKNRLRLALYLMCVLAVPSAKAAFITQTQSFELSVSGSIFDRSVNEPSVRQQLNLQDSTGVRFAGFDPALGLLTSITRTLNASYRGSIGASVKGSGVAFLSPLNRLGPFILPSLLPSGDDGFYETGFPYPFRTLYCTEAPFLCFAGDSFSGQFNNSSVLAISSFPEALLFNTKNDIFYNPQLSFSLGLAGARALDSAAIFGLGADIGLTGQLALTYEYTPATTPTGGPSLPEPSMLWLFGIGLLPLVVRQLGKKKRSAKCKKIFLIITLWASSIGFAAAIPITFTPVALEPTIFFPGTQQQTSLTIAATTGTTTLDLTSGVPFRLSAFQLTLLAGQNDGRIIFVFPGGGPDETRDIQFAFTFGSANITLSQSARVFQVNNDQFQYEVASGPTRTLDLGALGALELTPNTSFIVQSRSNSGGIIDLGTTFLLRAATPIPEPGVLSLLMLGLSLQILVLRGKRGFAAYPKIYSEFISTISKCGGFALAVGLALASPLTLAGAVCDADGAGGTQGSTAAGTGGAFACGIVNTASGGQSIAVGFSNNATGNQGIARGISNTASGTASSAVGFINTASGDGSSAVGALNTASGTTSSAIGSANISSGLASSAVGNSNTTSGTTSSAVGFGNNASASESSAFGNRNTSSGARSAAFGTFTTIGLGNDSIALGSGVSSITSARVGDSVTATSSAIAIGSDAAVAAGANGATAIGFGARANAVDSTSVGRANTAGGTSSSAVGAGNTASGFQSSAVGLSNSVSGSGSIAVGALNNTSGTASAALGLFNTAGGGNSSAFGVNNNANGIQSNAFGASNIASGIQSSTFGGSNTASGVGSIAVGFGNTASGVRSTASGTFSNVGLGSDSIALGSGFNGANSARVGDSVTATSFAIAIGADAAVAAGADGATALGFGARANSIGGTSVGNSNTASGFQSSAVGFGNTASNNQSNALGFSNTANGVASTAVGLGNAVSGTNSSAFGTLNTASGSSSNAVGNNNSANGNLSLVLGTNSVTGINATSAVAIGDSAVINVGAANAIAIGSSANAQSADGIAIGRAATAVRSSSIAIGAGAFAQSSVAVGVGAQAVGLNTTAVGDNAVALGNFAAAYGNNAQATHANSVALGNASVTSSANSVSVGAPGAERTIQNVAPGVQGTDAVNVDQLNAITGGQNVAAALSGLSASIKSVEKLASRGTAVALASAQALPVLEAGESGIGVGVGHFNGETAVGVSFGHAIKNNALLSLGVAISGGGKPALARAWASSSNELRCIRSNEINKRQTRDKSPRPRMPRETRKSAKI